MKFVDTHCHLNFSAYDEDRQQALQRAHDAGVTRIVIPAVDLKSIEEALQLATPENGIFVAAGIHPTSTANFTIEVLKTVRELANDARIVAIGEIGLDYYWDESPKSKQIEAFEAQLAVASDMDLPVIIHNRDSTDDVLRILEKWASQLKTPLRDRPGVMHSFSGDLPAAERAVAAGFYLGITGPVTFKKKVDELQRIVQHIPIDRLLVETDGPYLTPEPYRGRRNEPAYIPYIVRKIAELRGIDETEAAHVTTENANRLFQF